MTRIHHIAFEARDVERVAAFYRDVFDLVPVVRHHAADGSLRSIWLDLGDAVLMVERTFQDVEPGPFLIAFRVDAAVRADVEARLAASGSPIERRTEHTAYARDPEGNRVAISDYPLELA